MGNSDEKQQNEKVTKNGEANGLLDEAKILEILFQPVSNRSNYVEREKIIRIILEVSDKCEYLVRDSYDIQAIGANKISLPNVFYSLTKKMLSFVIQDRGDCFSEEFKDDIISIAKCMDSCLLDFKRGIPLDDPTIKKFVDDSEKIKELVISTLPGMEKEEHFRREAEFPFEQLFSVKEDDMAEIERLVKVAIDVVDESDSINKNTRNKILRDLKSALNSLRKGRVSGFYGNVIEVVMLLGAVGSFLGGVDATFPSAIESLKQSINIVERNAANPRPVYILKNCLPDDFSGSPTSYVALDFAELHALPPSVDSSKEDSTNNSDNLEGEF